MSRGDMTDSDWQRLQPLLPPEKTGKRGGQWRSHRQIIDGIRWIGRTGAPWRDLPERYGPWQTCADRLYRWQRNGTWLRLLQTLQSQEDATSNVEWDGVSIDSVTIKAHPHAAGARKALPTASETPSDAEKGGFAASQQTLPASQQTLPASQQTLPASQQTLPASQQTLPASQQTLPASQQTLPVRRPRLRQRPQTRPSRASVKCSDAVEAD